MRFHVKDITFLATACHMSWLLQIHSFHFNWNENLHQATSLITFCFFFFHHFDFIDIESGIYQTIAQCSHFNSISLDNNILLLVLFPFHKQKLFIKCMSTLWIVWGYWNRFICADDNTRIILMRVENWICIFFFVNCLYAIPTHSKPLEYCVW